MSINNSNSDIESLFFPEVNFSFGEFVRRSKDEGPRVIPSKQSFMKLKFYLTVPQDLVVQTVLESEDK